jgi:two-component system, chemotaxis family, CheB/CheR fusion protein
MASGAQVKTESRSPRFVVGIGASAGGLDPLVRFVERLPRDSGMAFVIVQHLSPDFRSVMDELLARHTPLPIHLVEDGMPVEADHIYLIPAKKEMIVSGGRLLLSERGHQQELTLPIDVFFRSLAQDYRSKAVAIVLSGGGSDGSRGIAHVHESGGLVLVQDLETAQFDGMPRAALETGVVDHTLRPEDMPRVLLERAAGSLGEPAKLEPEKDTLRGLEALYSVLETEFGLDFNHYKPSTVTRRIERRLGLAQMQSIDEYLARLRSERTELDALYRDLLIGVTRFFRDPEAFDLLEHRILPRLFAREPRNTPLRIWVAGCATGEEAYSMAILLQELSSQYGERPIKIFATDVHRGSLEQATLGIYGEDAIANVSPERLARYFMQSGDTYQVVPELRQMVVFAQHNVISDAPFTRVDLVACRNLLIYLQPPAQQRVLSFFHFALNQGGVLFLGPSETLGPLADGFEIIDKHWQLYRKATEVRTPIDRRPRSGMAATARLAVPPVLAPARHSLGQLLSIYDALLEETMPPSLLLTERGELVHALGGAGRFLRVRDGRQSLDVLELVDAELKMILAGGVKRALAERAPVVFNGVRVRPDDQLCRVTIRAIAGRAPSARLVVVSFEPQVAAPKPEGSHAIQIDVDQVSEQQLAALEAELGTTKESLQAAIEQLEAGNEELQASNEELQSSNEELQSTNEELQSVNEELYTVNAEYQRKIAELTELTNDMDNLLASTEIGTIFLDGQLRIRKFTPHVTQTFGLMPHDVGRSIETFAHKMRHPGLVDDLKGVISSGQAVERDLTDAHGKSFFLRLLPYRAKGIVDGVVLTLIDVSGLKAAEDALFHERYLLNSLLGTVPDAIYFKDARGRFIRCNHAMAARLGVADPAEAIGRTAFDMPHQDAAMALHREDEAVLRAGTAQHYRLERRLGQDGEAWDMVTRLPLVDRSNATVGVIAIFRDVTEQVRAKAKIDDEVRRRDQFLAMLSHELRNPLGAVVTATSMLKSGDGRDHARSIEVLERQSRQMARLLDDLLDASRVTQNKIELRRRVVDLRLIASEAAEAVRRQAQDRHLDLTVELADAPLWVHGDATRLQQIQINLLSNAIKYTPRGGRVRLSVLPDVNGTVVVRVSDSGAGIAPHMLDSVFDLFVQAKHTLDHSDGGLGVGLTLVRALVEMHGGTVNAHSDGDGKGSEFVVRLPAVAAPEEAQAQPAASAPALRRGTTVVVVEDNADSLEMLCSMLQLAGAICHSAGDGRAALALIDEVAPEVVILDVGLPHLDGLEVARRIRANPRHAGIRLIALTGYGLASDRKATAQAGFDHHLVKPVQPADLFKAIAEDSSVDLPRQTRLGAPSSH